MKQISFLIVLLIFVTSWAYDLTLDPSIKNGNSVEFLTFSGSGPFQTRQ